MKTTRSFFFLFLFCALFSLPLSAEETTSADADTATEDTVSEETPAPSHIFSGSITPEPLHYAAVSGDTGKFRELNWTQEGYDGGFENFNLEERYDAEQILATVDGHALIRNNDYEVNALIQKKDFGYVKLNYEEFSKYYDNTGAVYYPFAQLEFNSLNRDLELEIGEFRVETGITVEGYPHVNFAFARRFKDGAKSRLTLATVTEGGTSRGIGPSYADVNEIIDSVELNQSYTIKGVELKGNQTWEWSHAEISREERSLSTTGTATSQKVRQHDQDVEYQLFSTTESAERWFKDDTVFVGSAYHFLTIENDELENIFEKNATGSITNFSNPKQIRNARADNDYDDHVWTGNVMYEPLNWLNITTKVRAETAERSGNSAYPSDTTPVAAGGATPDGIINNTELSRTEDKVGRLGQGLSIRVTKIPRTAFYNEVEFEQLRNWLSEDRVSVAGQSAANAGETFGRETLTYMNRGIWTVGFQTMLAKWLNWTAHFRLNRSNADYDDKRETGATASGAKSAFLDAMNISTQEIATRFTFKPVSWFKPSARYQLQRHRYDTRVEDLANVEAFMTSHIYTFDITTNPLPNLLVMTGVSPQFGSVSSPHTQYKDDAHVPRFETDVISWLLNATYDVNERVQLTSGLEYARANNFNDFSSVGLPLGAAFNQINLNAGVEWKLSQLVSVMMDYGFMHYNGDSLVDAGDYNAHIVTTRTKFSWG